MSMTRKCHKHTLQNNPLHREEETHNTNSRMIKVNQNISLFLGEVIEKLERTLSTG